MALDQITELIPLLDEDTRAVIIQLRRLIERHGVAGRAVFDARLAATMLAHKIDRILTFNLADFSRFGVAALDPGSVP